MYIIAVFVQGTVLSLPNCKCLQNFWMLKTHLSVVCVWLFQFHLCPVLFFQIKVFEKLETDEERIKAGKDIYDQFIMKELLSQSHVSTAYLMLHGFLQWCPSYVTTCSPNAGQKWSHKGGGMFTWLLRVEASMVSWPRLLIVCENIV